MSNDEQRDHAEEAANRRLLREDAVYQVGRTIDGVESVAHTEDSYAGAVELFVRDLERYLEENPGDLDYCGSSSDCEEVGRVTIAQDEAREGRWYGDNDLEFVCEYSDGPAQSIWLRAVPAE